MGGEGPKGGIWYAEDGVEDQNYLTQLVLHTGGGKKNEQKIIIFELSVCRGDSLSETERKNDSLWKNVANMQSRWEHLWLLAPCISTNKQQRGLFGSGVFKQQYGITLSMWT